MSRNTIGYFSFILLVSLATIGVREARGFSLIGPFAEWQTSELNYNVGVGVHYVMDPIVLDVGGPQNLGEEYRWNFKTIFIGFDPSFVNYFGAKGTQAVWEAIQILNSLPPVSKMSTNLTEFPLNTRLVNYRASALRLLDIRSYALAAILNALGLASPERYTFTLRARTVNQNETNYTVIMRNFDPVTWEPSKYVNGVLYTYVIEELPDPWPSGSADAIEIAVDPLEDTYTSVVGGVDGFWRGRFRYGEFVTGLTRDDAGGLRYIYSPSNLNIETAPTNAMLGYISPWTPVYPGGQTNTNAIVNIALRPGVDKIEFKVAEYDKTYGYFITVTNTYEDVYYTNNTKYTQGIARILLQPDIIIAAGDLGLSDGYPILFQRSILFQNNTQLYSYLPPGVNGPGQIVPPVTIVFSKLGPYYMNTAPYWDEATVSAVGPLWGYFDASTNEPVVFPNGISLRDLERRVLGQ